MPKTTHSATHGDDRKADQRAKRAKRAKPTSETVTPALSPEKIDQITAVAASGASPEILQAAVDAIVSAPKPDFAMEPVDDVPIVQAATASADAAPAPTADFVPTLVAGDGTAVAFERPAEELAPFCADTPQDAPATAVVADAQAPAPNATATASAPAHVPTFRDLLQALESAAGELHAAGRNAQLYLDLIDRARTTTPHRGMTALVVEMLKRPGGATLAELMQATHWQEHYADVRIMPTCVGNPVCGAGIAAMESA